MSIIGLIIIAIVVICLLSTAKSARMETRDARSIFSRKCPNCTMRISDRAKVCRHCHEPTGFSQSVPIAGFVWLVIIAVAAVVSLASH